MERIKRAVPKIFSLIVLLTLLASCSSILVSTSEQEKREYGLLLTATTFASDKIIGQYGDEIPNDFTTERFMESVKDRIPKDYYEILERHQLIIIPKGSYYLLIVKDPANKAIILFDYSCTTVADGPVLNEPSKYDLENLDVYDTCRTSAE